MTTLAHAPTARIRTSVRVPLRFGDGYTAEADVYTFTSLADGKEHLALGLGNHTAWRAREEVTRTEADRLPGGDRGETPAAMRHGRAGVPLVRAHSECLTGDVFGSARCDCGPQLREAVERIATTGGYLLYLRQEGRGIGLYAKLDAYSLQDLGLDTYAANRALGHADDERDYTAAAQMLGALGVGTVDLLTNNPDKPAQLRALGVDVRDVHPTGVHASPENLRYLAAKVAHTAHTISLPAGLA